MRLLGAIAVVWLSFTAPQRAGAIVQGTVRDDRGTALAQAYVAIHGGDLRYPRSVLTDEAGHFAIRDVADGAFFVTASKPGYVTTPFGQSRPGDAGTPVAIANAAAPAAIDITLPRGGTIEGTLIGAGGRPVSGRVTPVPVVTPPRPAPGFNRSFGTAADGIFRADNLAPGTYVLEWNRVYAPSTRSLADARRVTIGPGETVTGVTITATNADALGSVSGTLLPSRDRALPATSDVRIYRAGDESPQPQTTTRATGASFGFDDLPPGRYTIVAHLSPATGRGGAMNAPGAWGLTTVDVGAGTRATTTVQLETSTTISGRVSVEPGMGGAPFSRMLVSVNVVPVDLPPALARSLPGSVYGRTETNGDFTIVNVPAGRFVIQASMNERAVYASSVRVSGREVIDEPIEIGPGIPGPIEVTISDRSSDVHGAVPPLARAGRRNVVLFSEDARHWWPLSPRVRVEPVAVGDRYSIRSVRPGRYLIALAGDPASIAAADLEKLRASAAPVTISAHVRQAINLSAEGTRTSAAVAEATPLPEPSGPRPQAQGPRPLTEAALSGATVTGQVRTESGTPATGVVVVIFPTGDQATAPANRTGRAVVTNGAYSLAGLPAGNYKLSVGSPETLAKFPEPALLQQLDRAGFPMALAANERALVNLTVPATGEPRLVNIERSQLVMVGGNPPGSALPPGSARPPGAPMPPSGVPPFPRPPASTAPGSITGIVTDASGKPIANVPVQVARRLNTQPTTPLQPFGQAVLTDVNGFYRITGVPAGNMVVVALGLDSDLSSMIGPKSRSVPPVVDAAGRKTGLFTTFYPSVAHAAEARVVPVTTTEVERIDISMRSGSLSDVKGRIVFRDTNLRMNAMLVLAPAAIADHIGGRNVYRAIVAPDGQFNIADVETGSYTITYNGAEGWVRHSLVVVEREENLVIGAPTRGLELTPMPYLRVSGRVDLKPLRLPGGAEALKQMTVSLTPTPLVSGSPLYRVAVTAEGTFEFARVAGGTYTLSIAEPAYWIAISGLINGVDSLDVPAAIDADVADTTLVLTDQPVSVRGMVTTAANQPAMSGSVVIFSEDQRLWTPGATRRVRVVTIAPGGSFTTTGLPPGKYRIAAVASGTTITNRYLETLMSTTAIPVELAIGESRTLNLVLK